MVLVSSKDGERKGTLESSVDRFSRANKGKNIIVRVE